MIDASVLVVAKAPVAGLAKTRLAASVGDATAADIIHTSAISGVAANFLRPSLVLNGLDPDSLPPHGTLDLGSEARVWKTVWSAGQGVGRIADIPAAGDLCDRLAAEYRAARARIAADPFG